MDGEECIALAAALNTLPDELQSPPGPLDPFTALDGCLDKAGWKVRGVIFEDAAHQEILGQIGVDEEFRRKYAAWREQGPDIIR